VGFDSEPPGAARVVGEVPGQGRDGGASSGQARLSCAPGVCCMGTFAEFRFVLRLHRKAHLTFWKPGIGKGLRHLHGKDPSQGSVSSAVHRREAGLCERPDPRLSGRGHAERSGTFSPKHPPMGKGVGRVLLQPDRAPM